MKRKVEFGKKKGKTYRIEEFDKFNFVIIETYKSRAKGHEGKEVEKILGYYSCVDHALSVLVRLQIDEAFIAQEDYRKAVKELKSFYTKNNTLKELIKDD